MSTPDQPDKLQPDTTKEDVASTEQHGNQSSKDMAEKKSGEIEELAEKIKRQPDSPK